MPAWLAFGFTSPFALAAGLWFWYRWQRRREVTCIVNAICAADAVELSLLLAGKPPLDSVAEQFGEPALILVLKSLAAGRCGMCFALKTFCLLLSHGADVNESGTEWKTALMHAGAAGYWDLCEILLSFGANPDARDMFGRTAVEWAEYGRHGELARRLQAARN